MGMNRKSSVPGRPVMQRAGRVALLVLAMVAGADAAAQGAGDVDRRLRELELERDQERARREMEQRERIQRDALRDQQRIIQRQEERLDQMRFNNEQAARESAALATDLSRNYTYNINVVDARAAAQLGITVDTSERRDGALVSLVHGGGAAEAAGLRAGDLVTAIDGVDLTREPNPGRALADRLQALQPGVGVNLGVLRDGRRMNIDVAARATPPLPPVDDILRRRIDERPRATPPPAVSVLGDLQFAALSTRLGRYFGVTEGVLVLRAGANAPFGLQDGDVVLSVDGRKPTDASHLGRILGSYQPGEKLKLRVQRDRKAIDLDTVAPGAGSR